MNRKHVLMGVMCLLLAGSLWWASTVRAEPQATYELVKSHVGPSASGNSGAYALSGSIGQPDAGQVSAGIYILGSGFWGGGIVVSATIYDLYVPLIIK